LIFDSTSTDYSLLAAALVAEKGGDVGDMKDAEDGLI